jgi:hypothetical protein
LDPQQELLLQQKAAYALKARSKSLNDRLLNEINLVYQCLLFNDKKMDGHVLTEITQGFNLVLQADSAWMKTIAFVSMVYLPGTFVSVSTTLHYALLTLTKFNYAGPLRNKLLRL